jgi:hypothetical protein
MDISAMEKESIFVTGTPEMMAEFDSLLEKYGLELEMANETRSKEGSQSISQKPYDPNLAKNTMPKKFVTSITRP